jgi:hypothetical protein
MASLDDLSREDLVKLIEMHAKCWLAHDGCWFLAAEEKYGMADAIELDTQAVERFTAIEARRIMQAFEIPEGSGLDGLEKALGYRLYATINPQRIERVDESTLTFKMLECRVQNARRRKGLPVHPCKPVGLVEYGRFAETIDRRIHTRCLQCPPDPVVGSGFVCGWAFTLQGHDTAAPTGT